MKKHILVLFALACSFVSASALNLKDAYDALSNIPHVSAIVDDTIAVSVNKTAEYRGVMQVAGAHGLDRGEIKASGDATLAVLDRIPLSYMINGGCNGYVAAFVYCMPNGSGANDMLIVTMSGELGDLTYLYVTDLNESDKLSLQEARLTMQDNYLSIIPLNSDGFIGAIKVN